MSRLTYFTLCVLFASLTGCASFDTVFLHRDESNRFWAKDRMLHGIPVTLKVPTHVKVDVVEKYYLYQSPEGNKVCRLQTRFPVRGVNHDYIYTDKLFVVDLKRPAAGTIDTNIKLDPKAQYFTEIKNQVTDETIQQVSKLLAAVAPGGLVGAPTAGEMAPDRSPAVTDVKEVQSTVASEIFEINAPDFEQQMLAFLDRHLNCCHDCTLLPAGVCPPAKLQPDYPEAQYQNAQAAAACRGPCHQFPAPKAPPTVDPPGPSPKGDAPPRPPDGAIPTNLNPPAGTSHGRQAAEPHIPDTDATVIHHLRG